MVDGVERREVSEAEIDAVLRGVRTGLGALPTRRKADWTVEELYRTTLPARVWIVPELLPAGLAALAGRPKIGKSLLALQLAAAVGVGRDFLGYEVQAGPVLFLALEDSPQRLQERLQRLQVTENAPLQFYTEWAALTPGTGGLRDLQECVAELQPRLVVIDTLNRALWGAVSRAEQVSATLTALQILAQRHNCCVLTVDHHRKDERRGDAVDDLLGHTSKAAALDTVWGLYGGRGEQGVKLRVMGREVAPCELALEFDAESGLWRRAPEPVVVPKETAATEVGRALVGLGGAATTAELASALGMPAGNVSRALARLVAAGRVRRLPRVGHGVPYEWVGEEGRE